MCCVMEGRQKYKSGNLSRPLGSISEYGGILSKALHPVGLCFFICKMKDLAYIGGFPVASWSPKSARKYLRGG